MSDTPPVPPVPPVTTPPTPPVVYPTPTGYTLNTPYDPAPPPPPDEPAPVDPVPVAVTPTPTPTPVPAEPVVVTPEPAPAPPTEAAWYVKLLVFVGVLGIVFGTYYANHIGLISIPLPTIPN